MLHQNKLREPEHRQELEARDESERKFLQEVKELEGVQ
jgi:hypothetical protein